MVDLNIPIALHGFDKGILEGFDDPRLGNRPVKPWEPNETRHYVVQFVHSLFEEERTELQERFGLELEAYIPQYAYIERVDEQTVAELSQHSLVNGLFPLEAVHKESPGIGQTEFRDPARNARNDFRLWAVLFSNEELDVVEQKLRDVGATEIVVTDDTADGGVARIEFTIETLDPLKEIAEIDTVNWIEEVPEISPNGAIPSGWMQSGSVATPFTAAGLTGKDEVVGILDEHLLNVNHCWFSDAAHPAHNPLHRKVIACHGTAGDVPRHAVFVAGILCGNDLANPARRGIAHEAKIAYGNSNNFRDTGTAATFYTYLNKVRLNQASVINNSWHSNSTPTYSQDAVDADRFAWRFERILIVGSAANSGETMGPPGSAKNALCVGAAYVDETGSCFADGGVGSEFIVEIGGSIIGLGTVEGGRRKPDLLAPGCNIDSANTATACNIVSDSGLNPGSASPGNPTCPPAGLNVYCATSYATPVVSAAAAIVRQYFREGRYETGNSGSPPVFPTSAFLKAILLNATQQVTNPAITDYPVTGEGWGLLRLNRVLRLPGQPKKIAFWDFPRLAGLFRGGSRTETVVVNSNAQHLKVTLVWTEPPGVLDSEDPVVNNLDLVVTSPSGARYLGNWFLNGESAPDTPLQRASADPANNVEMVLVKQPEPGNWTITVTATEVNAGRTGQGYALVVRGDLA